MDLLLIEDERPMALAVTRLLRSAGYNVTWEADGATGLEMAKAERFHVIVMDLLLPGLSGWQVLKELRLAKVNAPVLIVSGLDEVTEKVQGLSLGADDYLAKPFDTRELVARVDALVRRERVAREHLLHVGDLTLDRVTHTVMRAGNPVRLTRREYDLLEALVLNEGRVLSRDMIQERVWSADEAYSNTVDVFIRTLRKKLDAPFGQSLIHTAPGAGYVLRAG